MKSYIKPEVTVIYIELEGVIANSPTFSVSEKEHEGGISRARNGFWGEE